MADNGSTNARGELIDFIEGDDGTSVYIRFPAHDPAATPSINSQRLGKIIEDAGYGELYPIDDTLLEAVNRYNEGKESGDLGIALERRDAQLQVRFDPDKMRAQAFTVPAFGGQALDKHIIHSTLMREGIVYGVIAEAVDEIVSKQRVNNLLIAQGRPPEHGDDAKFETLIPEAARRGPVIDDRGRADYRELGDVPMVKPGDPVLRKIPPTQGVNGENIFGKVIPATPGEDFPFSDECEGVAVDDYDPNILVATVAGQPVIIENGAVVEGTFHTKDIDLSTGNIRFDGTIEIDRDVMQGMKVQATGDIKINGSVEGATLIAGGSIEINGGIIGTGDVRDENEEISRSVAQLHSGNKVTANFVQNAYIEAVGDIEIKRSIAHSEVTTSKGKIVVGTPKSSRGGNILGGVIRAPQRIEAQAIGSAAHPETWIEVGVDPALQEAIDNIDEQLEPRKGDLIKVVRLINEINQHKKKFPPTLQTKARETFLRLREEVTRLTAEREKLNSAVEVIFDARVAVGREVHPGVIIRMGSVTLEVSHEMKGTTFRRDGDEIVYGDDTEEG
jgi:uncharacterized protein (DUF342 family)